MGLAIRRLHPLLRRRDPRRGRQARGRGDVRARSPPPSTSTRCCSSAASRLTDEEQIAFSQRFGPLETTIRTHQSRQERTLPEISNLANVDAEDRLIPKGDKRNLFNAGNQMWHTDSSFKRVPALASLLSGREVPPEGGETEFASMRVALRARCPRRRRRILEGKVAIHSFVYSRGLVGDGPHARPSMPPRCRRCRRRWCAPTRRTAARPSTWPRTPARSSGMPTAEARALIRELLERATRPELGLHAPLAGR